MFDNTPTPSPAEPRPEPAASRAGPEDERIALRCNRKELQLLDSFVVSGEFRSRSELMRSALRQFLRERAQGGTTVPGQTGSEEVPVKLRRDEIGDLTAYGELVANGTVLPDLLAQLVRRGALELKVSELVERSRKSVRDSAKEQAQVQELGRSGAELTRRGIIGR
ncbi:MAG: ribbon-helix-helix domain-containing protein [Thermoplasmata archaeon]